MRTTLNIDDDVLHAAKELANRERKTAGQFISQLIREALGERAIEASRRRTGRELYGFEPIRAGGQVVTDELVNELRGELGV